MPPDASFILHDGPSWRQHSLTKTCRQRLFQMLNAIAANITPNNRHRRTRKARKPFFTPKTRLRKRHTCHNGGWKGLYTVAERAIRERGRGFGLPPERPFRTAGKGELPCELHTDIYKYTVFAMTGKTAATRRVGQNGWLSALCEQNKSTRTASRTCLGLTSEKSVTHGHNKADKAWAALNHS